MASSAPSTARRDRLVIAASSLGTVFEWYDFYLYGLLATIISASSSRASTRRPASSSRSPPSPPASRCGRSARSCSAGSAIWSAANIPSSSPWRSWACRPSLVGLLPSYASVGRRRAGRCWSRCGCSRAWRSAANMAARRPMSPSMPRTGRRGLYTSFIQTTATLGLFAALLVVIGIRTALGEEAFARLGLADALPASRSCCSRCRCGSGCSSRRARSSRR